MLGPIARQQAQRILDRAARRILDEQREQERLDNLTASKWLEDRTRWALDEFRTRKADEGSP